MAHLRAQLAPGRVYRPIGEFDQIQCVLDVFVELIQLRRLAGIELAGHAAVENGQRPRADIFSQLEVFVKAQAKRLEIIGRGAKIELVVPAVDDRPALGDIAHRGLPAVASHQAAAFDDAAAGKADESRVHIVEQLHQVLAQAVGAVVPRVHGEERDHVEIDGTRAIDEEVQPRFRLGGIGANDGFIVLPFAAESLQLAAADFVPRSVGEGGADRGWSVRAHVGGEAIFGALFHAHAAKAHVIKAIA